MMESFFIALTLVYFSATLGLIAFVAVSKMFPSMASIKEDKDNGEN